MDCSSVYGGPNLASLLHDSSNSLLIPSSSPTILETIVRFDHHHVGHQEMEEINELNQRMEKKRRLTQEQVELLEKNFRVENKLEPHRKMQVAKELGLEPRQVAIWFQNKRARFKIKQLEKEFECLKATYDQLKLDYDHLLKEKEGLQNEVEVLTNKIKQRNSSRPNSDPNNNMDNQLHRERREKIEPGSGPGKVIEDASSTKSDVLDLDTPHCNIHWKHSLFLEDPNRNKIFDPEEEDPGLRIDESLLFQIPYNITSYNNINSIDYVVKLEDI